MCSPPLRNPIGAGNDFYMVLGTLTSKSLQTPTGSHTFAVFCRCDKQNIQDMKTISWMPQSMSVRAANGPAEPGVNLSYGQTLNLCARTGYHVQFYGPHKVSPELYRRACERIIELDSGKVQYKWNDSGTRPQAVNCLHAVSDVDTDFGYPNTPSTRKMSATESVSVHLQRWITWDNKDHRWLIQKIQEQKDK
jgi:hypothetical protein